MYNRYPVIYMLIIIIPNVNLLVVENSNLSHLDRLYFKHNKRHKGVSNYPNNMPYSFQKPLSINSLCNDHINSLKDRTLKKKFDRNKAKTLNTLFSVEDSISKQKEDFEGNVQRIEDKLYKPKKIRKNFGRFEREKRQKGKNKEVKDPEFEKKMYKDKIGIGEKISEYENIISDLKKLSKSDKKSDKDLYSFISKSLKEQSIDLNAPLKRYHIIRSIKKKEKLDESTVRKWKKYIKSIRMKPISKLEEVEKNIIIDDAVKYNIGEKAREDSCGFRYPIEGSPEEIYTNPEEYKFWGRTPLSQSQTAHATREPMGKLSKKVKELDEIIASNSATYEERILEDLKKLREEEFKKKMDDVWKDRSINIKDGTDRYDKIVSTGVDRDRQDKKYKYRTEEYENYYEHFKRNFLESESEGQERILKVLNRYNPWDEYIKIKNLKSALPKIGINYKINMENMKVKFKSEEEVEKNKISNFLMDYLHYFLILESDEILFREFKNAKFMYDVLKYFDIKEQIPKEEKLKKVMSLQDRIFKIYYPKECPDGVPKGEPNAEFPITLDSQSGLMTLSEKVTGRPNSYHRVNVVNCLMALVRCYPLVRTYSADIYSEQRFKHLLDTIEKGLMLELERLEYGITGIEVNHVNYKSMCKIDGIYLETLTEVLMQWNLKRGIENILDLVMLITLKKMDEIDAKSLVTIANNVSYLTTLPESIHINFLEKVVDYIHEKINYSIMNKVECMPLEEALDFVSLLSKYPSIVTRQFMESFMQLYGDSIIEFGKRVDEDVKQGLSPGSATDADELDLKTMVEGRRYKIYALVSCLQLSGMTEYMYLLNDVTGSFISDDLELNSVTSISVLSSFNESDEFQRRVIMRAKNCLVKNKYQIEAYRIVRVLEEFTRGVKEGRLEEDSNFYCTMIKRFAHLKDPDSQSLIDAARITDEFCSKLTSGQLFEIFRDLTRVPLFYNFMTRIGMRGEYLDYPISTMAKVLYYASKSKVMIEENWVTFYEIIYVFKHILTLEDINLVLDSLIVAKFTKADKLLEILCKRVCNLMEITEIAPDKILDVMNKCLELDHVPMQLLRYYTYSNMYELHSSELVQSLVDGPREYDVDFRGWKRPFSDEEHTETIKLHHNVYGEVKMRGSRPILHEAMTHPLQPTYDQPKHFKRVKRKQVDYNVLTLLAEYFNRVKMLRYEFSESDSKLMSSLEKLLSAKGINSIYY